MRDDEHRFPGDEENYSEDDVPFKLPRTDDADEGGNIHKDDTDEIEALHAADRPETRAVDDMAPTVPYLDVDDSIAPDLAAGDYRPDEDVPFKLPKDAEEAADGPIASKFLTMPNVPPRQPQPTLPGSGGLDPNPDFQTVQRQPPPQSKPTIQRPAPQVSPNQQRYQRPAPYAPPAQQGARPPAQGMPQPGQAPMPPGQSSGPLPRRRRRRGFRPGCLAIFIGVLLTFCGGLTLVTTVAGVVAYSRVGTLLNERLGVLGDCSVNPESNFQSTFIYDRNGVQLYEVFGEGRRVDVTLDQMPQSLIDATVSIEDDSFYSNIGIDIPATTLAMLRFVGASSEETAGGSTITQQLVRNVLFDPEYRSERTPQRKAEEILLAIALTQRCDKDKILELYLNTIYYGNLAYGAESAANAFFDKPVSELTLGEAALLAALPQAPADLDPLNPDPAVQADVINRWQLVLNEMVQDGKITDAQRSEAIAQGLSFNPGDVELRAPHFTVFALEQLQEELGFDPNQGLQVYTSVDVRINDLAQTVAAQQVNSLPDSYNVSNGAVVVINPSTGEVLAMVGSIDYNSTTIDGRFNVVTGLRQPGSTMKPFTYSSAIELGMTPGDVIWDTHISIPQFSGPPYEPVNYDRSYHGPQIMRYALANSYNIPAVQTLRQVGVQYLLDLMQRFGVQSLGSDASFYGLSLTLGGGDISPLELTRAYSVFANEGYLVDTHAILCVLDNDDNILYEYAGGCPRGNLTDSNAVQTDPGALVLDPRIAFLISDILGDNAARSTAMGGNSDLYTPGITTAVKTGTTNDVKDNWTVGYTHNVAVGVWVGNNNGDPMVGTSGLTGAAPIWNDVMNAIYADASLLNEFAHDGQLENDQLLPPDGITQLQICDIRSLSDPAVGCPRTVNEWFLNGPAGLPDGQGGLYYPPSNDQQNNFGSAGYVEEISPGIYRSIVYRLDPGIASAIQFQVAPGEPVPPPPLYCRIPVDAVSSTPGAAEQWFITPPPWPADAVEAENYARAHGLAILPSIDCTPELLAGGGGYGPTVITAVISSPAQGEVVSTAAPIPIYGTVQFSPEQASFYKVEISGGQFGDQWVTLGDVHYTSVINGQLETLYTPGLAPGTYRLKLAVIGLDGNAVQAPFEIQIVVQ